MTEPVRDGREAVARARAFAPDLIVMDIQMPHVTGYELIERAEGAMRRWRAIPIMAVTAYAGREDEERIRAAGADAYVSKPISLARFVDAVSGAAADRAATERRGPRGGQACDAGLRRADGTGTRNGRRAVRRGPDRPGSALAPAGSLDLGFLELDMLAHDGVVLLERQLLGLACAGSSS